MESDEPDCVAANAPPRNKYGCAEIWRSDVGLKQSEREVD
jgi:hypothetical protein